MGKEDKKDVLWFWYLRCFQGYTGIEASDHIFNKM